MPSVWSALVVLAVIAAVLLLGWGVGYYPSEMWDDLVDSAYTWWGFLWSLFRKKEAKVNSAAGGGNHNLSGTFVRCASCKGPVSPICHRCGPAAPIEWVIPNGGAGVQGVAQNSGMGGGGGPYQAQQVSPGVQYNFTVGGGGSATWVCKVCATPIPSGEYCTVSCLRQGMPNLIIYNSSSAQCWDCGSGYHPTYSPGCTQAGRVTGYLPIPGPYGSPGLAASGVAVPGPAPLPYKPPIAVNGMHGYSEHGTPDEWDMAIGVIRGYRWFKIEIPESWVGAVNREVKPGFFDVLGKPSVSGNELRELKDSELPSLIGAYNGTWDDGLNEAKCRRSLSNRPGQGFTHEPPEIREACGCGFWAYFDPNLSCSLVLSGWETGKIPGWVGMAVLGCVEGSGRVIIGEKGYRAQYSKIVALTIGQLAMPRLTWWLDTKNCQVPLDPQSLDRAIRPTTYNSTISRVQCSDEEIYRRMAKIEDMLARKYPSARILTSENSLRALYPPDENYGGK